MANLSMEVQSLVAFLTGTGVKFRVTATLGQYISPTNPCSPHSPGSYHCRPGTNGQGLAADFAGPSTGAVASELLPIWSNLVNGHEQNYAELIYAGAPYCIKDGKRVNGWQVYGGTVMRAHYNHVHAAVNKGTFLVPMPDPSQVKENIVPDIEVWAEPVSISVTPSGKGYYILCKDGGVFSFGDAVYFGRVHLKP